MLEYCKTYRQHENLTLRDSQLLGSGTLGQVLSATWNGKAVAVKRLSPGWISELEKATCKDQNDQRIEQITKEARILQLLGEHKNIIQYLGEERDSNGKTVCIYEEKGSSLAKYLNSNYPVSKPKIIPYIIGLYQGLEHIHGNSISHNNISLNNVVLGDDGELKICDFGDSYQAAPQANKYFWSWDISNSANCLRSLSSYLVSEDRSLVDPLLSLIDYKSPEERPTARQCLEILETFEST